MRNPSAPRDCVVDARVVADVLREQFPELAPHDARFLRSGWDHDAYEVNGEWIVRMPMRAAVAALVPVERAVLSLAREALSIDVPVVALRGVPSGRYPYPFSGYRKLTGVSADQVPLTAFCSAANAQILGRALGALHRVPAAVAQAAGVPHARPDEDSAIARANRVFANRAAIERVIGSERARRCAPLMTERPLLDPSAAPRVLRHDDLYLEHVLVDPETAVVSGIIDWTDASIGDPAAEFALLLACCGEEFVGEVIGWYGGPADADLLRRARIFSRWGVLDWIGNSAQRDPDSLPEWLACFDRAFEAR